MAPAAATDSCEPLNGQLRSHTPSQLSVQAGYSRESQVSKEDCEALLQPPPSPPPPPPRPVGERPPRRLGLASEVEEHQRRDFIVGYYRLEQPRLQHLISCHNETLNIWTHFVGTIYFAIRGFAWISAQMSQDQNSALIDQSQVYYSSLVVLLLISGGYCMGSSTVFHWCSCSPIKEHACYLSLDRSGILTFICSSFLVGISMGYSCVPEIQKVYLVLTCISCIGMVASLTIPQLQSYTTMILLAGGLWGLIPTLHWFLFVANKTMMDEIGSGIALGALLFLVSAFWYFSGLPERLAPGRFDLVGTSHQIFHCFVFVACAVFVESLIHLRWLLLFEPAFCN